MAMVALFSLASSCQTASKRESGSQSDLQIIDVHTHTRFTGKLEPITKIMQSREEFLRERKEAGVIAAVSHTAADENGFNADMKEQHNVLHCAGLGPKVNAQKLEADLRSGKYGCIKVYLGYVHQWASDKSYAPAYQLAKKYDVPVVFHTGDIYTSKGKLKYADPLTVDEVAVDHPDVTFVIAHCGNPWIQSAAEVAYKNPNVYLECSALLIGDVSELEPEIVETYLVKPVRWIFDYVEDPSKMMFGTDWPLNRVKPYLDAYKRAIPREHWQAVFHDNALKVFKRLKKP
jgi:hypothetical protein